MKFYFILTLLFTYMINFTLGNSKEQSINGQNDPRMVSKEALAREISLKIQSISQRVLRLSKTPAARYMVLRFLKEKLHESAKKRNKDIDASRLHLYVNLIVKGVEMNMRKQLHSLRDQFNETDMDARRFNDIEENNETQFFNMTTLSKSDNCGIAVKRICLDLTNVHKLTCKIDETFVMVEKLCDGVMDCPDASDELNCSSQALSMIHKINLILRRVDTYISQDCLKGTIELPVISSQNIALHDILNSQIQLIQSYDTLNINRRQGEISATLTQHMNDVANVVLTIARAMESSICIPNELKCASTSKLIEVQKDIHKKLAKLPDASTAKPCQCNNQHCKHENCPKICKTICRNKYLLERLPCKAINGQDSIGLDFICDGKLDCFDEIDEERCDVSSVLSKFERNAVYESLLVFMKSKSAYKDYAHVNAKIQALYNTVRKLSTLTLKSKLELASIKRTRNEAFSILKSIYDDLIKVQPADHGGVYRFVSEIGTKLINALIKSSVGNEKVVTPNECLCSNDICIIPRCSKKCQRACSVEMRLTRFNCMNTHNATVPIEFLCNGEPDCKYGDDEADCRKDVCRLHHIVVLGNTIKSVGENMKGTALGEILASWRMKALETIRVATGQTEIRPSRIAIRRIMIDILDELVLAYASLETFRKTANNYQHVYKEFEKVSRSIINSYKLCLK